VTITSPLKNIITSTLRYQDMKKGILIAGLAAILVGSYGYYQFNRGHESMASQKAELSTDAGRLFAAFGEDETKANTTYLGKTIEIKGKVSTSVQEDGGTTITLFADSETGGVSCKLDPLAQHAQTSFAEGQEITVKGICTGYLMDVVLERCVVK
jgi:tRNA_anti-like